MKLPAFKSFYTESDIQAVNSVIKRGMFWADGPEIESTEKSICDFLKVQNCLLFNSGTSALYSFLCTIGIEGKEVIVPSFTFIATANAVELAGGKVVFADSEIDTFGLSAKSVIEKITENTKLIININYGGLVSRDAVEIAQFAHSKGLLFIEDSAQSFGATVQGQHVGAYSDGAIFSFCQNKVITALGEGGAIVTNNDKFAKKATLLRSHGRLDLPDKKHFETHSDNAYLFPGHNFRMPSASAAFLSSQLDHISENLVRRERNASIYHVNLLGLADHLTCPVPPQGFRHCYQMYTVTFKSSEMREKVRERLLAEGVMVRCYFEPLHRKEYYAKKNKNLSLPVAEDLGRRVLTLPMFPELAEEDIQFVCNIIRGEF